MTSCQGIEFVIVARNGCLVVLDVMYALASAMLVMLDMKRC